MSDTVDLVLCEESTEDNVFTKGEYYLVAHGTLIDRNNDKHDYTVIKDKFFNLSEEHRNNNGEDIEKGIDILKKKMEIIGKLQGYID